MSTQIEKAPAKPTGRKYASVKALLSGTGASKALKDKLAEFGGETLVTLQLARLRQEAGLTQEEMAKHLGVTQSTISKLEAGSDREITLHEIREYARVTDRRIGVMFGKPMTHVEAIRLHAHGLKQRLEALAEIASQNDELQKEIKGFFGEAFFNLFNILASCNDTLPSGDGDHVEIRVEIVRGNQPPIPLAAVKQGKIEEVAA